MSSWDKIPEEMKACKQWVLWKKVGKEKRPFQINGKLARLYTKEDCRSNSDGLSIFDH